MNGKCYSSYPMLGEFHFSSLRGRMSDFSYIYTFCPQVSPIVNLTTDCVKYPWKSMTSPPPPIYCGSFPLLFENFIVLYYLKCFPKWYKSWRGHLPLMLMILKYNMQLLQTNAYSLGLSFRMGSRCFMLMKWAAFMHWSNGEFSCAVMFLCV